MLRSDSVRVASGDHAPAAKTPPVSRTCEPSQGPIVVPSELKACERFRRKWEPLRAAQLGHQRVGRDLKQGHARGDDEQRDQNARIPVRHRRSGTIRQPATMVASAAMIARLYPSRASTAAAGSEATP